MKKLIAFQKSLYSSYANSHPFLNRFISILNRCSQSDSMYGGRVRDPEESRLRVPMSGKSEGQRQRRNDHLFPDQSTSSLHHENGRPHASPLPPSTASSPRQWKFRDGATHSASSLLQHASNRTDCIQSSPTLGVSTSDIGQYEQWSNPSSSFRRLQCKSANSPSR